MRQSKPLNKSLLIIAVTSIIAACAAPGAPKIRTNSNDGYGELVPDCRNVSPSTNVAEYDTSSYHSTWMSAWMEGAQAGVKEGLNLEAEANERSLYKKEFAYALFLQLFGIDGRNPPFPPFCMRFDASEADVKQALGKILPRLGNALERDGEDFGIFGTEFIDREHRAAKWRDRYAITVRETTTNQIDVTVFRELLISRQDYPYDRARSSGHNEAWLLQQIAAEVAQ